MRNITDFLDEIERLAYKILLWVLLLPKTLLKIIFEPNWVPGYVKEELSGDTKQAFDNYMSPVVLFLIVTVIPAILISFAPTMGMSVYNPEPYSEDDLRTIEFTVNGTFISSTNRVFHRAWWEVWQVTHTDQTGNPVNIEYRIDNDNSIIYVDENGEIVDKPQFTFDYGEFHDEFYGIREFEYSESGKKVYSEEQFYPSGIFLLDNNTIEGDFYYVFPEGEFQIRITIENYGHNDQKIETQKEVIYVTVPSDITKKIYFDSYSMVFDDQISRTDGSGFSLEALNRSLESGGTYLLALGLLSLPLLFSFGTKILDVEGLGETSLKNSFYMQCYYFSPISAVFWSSLYAFELYTSDIYSIAQVLPIAIFALIFMWFCKAEIDAIKIERGVSTGRAWAILSMLMVILASGALLGILIINDFDYLRIFLIAFYPLFGAGVFIAYILRRRRERHLKKQQPVEPEQKT